jgi:hypothetical protein
MAQDFTLTIDHNFSCYVFPQKIQIALDLALSTVSSGTLLARDF